MPEKDWRILVRDMVEYAQHARMHAAGMDEASFLADLKTIHAVTRCVARGCFYPVGARE